MPTDIPLARDTPTEDKESGQNQSAKVLPTETNIADRSSVAVGRLTPTDRMLGHTRPMPTDHALLLLAPYADRYFVGASHTYTDRWPVVVSPSYTDRYHVGICPSNANR